MTKLKTKSKWLETVIVRSIHIFWLGIMHNWVGIIEKQEFSKPITILCNVLLVLFMMWFSNLTLKSINTKMTSYSISIVIYAYMWAWDKIPSDIFKFVLIVMILWVYLYDKTAVIIAADKISDAAKNDPDIHDELMRMKELNEQVTEIHEKIKDMLKHPEKYLSTIDDFYETDVYKKILLMMDWYPSDIIEKIILKQTDIFVEKDFEKFQNEITKLQTEEKEIIKTIEDFAKKIVKEI